MPRATLLHEIARHTETDRVHITPPTEIELSRAFFDDVDRFSEWESELGMEVESLQLSSGINEISFDHFACPELIVSHFRSKRSMQNLFALPDGMILIVICRAKSPVFWCGRHLPPSLMSIVRSVHEHWVVLPDEWDCYEFFVSEDLVRRTELFPPRFFTETTQPERAFVPLVEPITAWFLRRMDSCFRQAGGSNGSSGVAVHETQFFDFVIDELQQLIDAGLRESGSHGLRRARRPDLVAKGRDFVSAKLRADVSADDMAQALGVSYRVLNYAFRDSLGVSPYRYIQTEKLHAARRLLQRSDVSVSEACLSLGFQKPARFSEQYSRLFGELPSMTGRARPRAAG